MDFTSQRKKKERKEKQRKKALGVAFYERMLSGTIKILCQLTQRPLIKIKIREKKSENTPNPPSKTQS